MAHRGAYGFAVPTEGELPFRGRSVSENVRYTASAVVIADTLCFGRVSNWEPKKGPKGPWLQSSRVALVRSARSDCPGRKEGRKGGGTNWYLSIPEEQKRDVLYNYAVIPASSRSYDGTIPPVNVILAKKKGLLRPDRTGR